MGAMLVNGVGFQTETLPPPARAYRWPPEGLPLTRQRDSFGVLNSDSRGWHPKRIKKCAMTIAFVRANHTLHERKVFVMRDDLDEQIEAYETLLPTIRREHGSVWVLVADKKLIKTFPVFSDAARYAREHFGKQQALIRHTDERKIESAPFIHVHAEG